MLKIQIIFQDDYRFYLLICFRAIKSGNVSLESPMAEKSPFGDTFTPPAVDPFSQLNSRSSKPESHVENNQETKAQPPVILESVIYEDEQKAMVDQVTPVKSRANVADDVIQLGNFYRFCI